MPDRRGVLAGLAAAAAWPGRLVAQAPPSAAATPIAPGEYAGRVAKLQRLLRDAGIAALVVEAGSSLAYFTGVRWSRSERLTAAVIPGHGEPALVTPFFERPSVVQMLKAPAEVRTWQEDEDPHALVAAILRDRAAAAGPIAIEDTVRFFAFDGLRRALPDARLVSGTAPVRACRMIKSAAEIALMQRATDITVAAYRRVVPQVRAGMAPHEIGAMMDAATVALGGTPEFSMALVDAAAALPHGSREPQRVRPGSLVLMDCGCTVEGYQSDVSRTFVVGGATARQRQVWDQVAHGQRIAFAAARVGTEAGRVDDAVRRYYAGLGYGPRYALPGLSHRTGHGIGLDGHEPVNLVHGETTRLAPGMCFSNEPGLYVPGELGVRIEDCFHMTADGPRWFSEPPHSIDAPV